MISPALSNSSNKFALLGKQPLLKHSETAQHSNKPHSTGQPGIENTSEILSALVTACHTQQRPGLQHLLKTGLDHSGRSGNKGEEMSGLSLHRHSLGSAPTSRSVTATALALPPLHLLRKQIPKQTLMQSQGQTMTKESLAPCRQAGSFPGFWFGLGPRGFGLDLGVGFLACFISSSGQNLRENRRRE